MTMNDRFAAQLRQHLLDSANERAADGQLASVLVRVADTNQRHGLAERLGWLPGRIGPFPSEAVRFGVIAIVLALGALAVLAFAGSDSPSRSTVFEGRWAAADPDDSSGLALVIGEGLSPGVHYEDNFTDGEPCGTDEVVVYTGDGVGTISGSRLTVTLTGGGCMVQQGSFDAVYDHDPDADTLTDQDGHVWTRAGGDGVPATLPPGPSPTAFWVFAGRWIATDPGDGSGLTLIVREGLMPDVRFRDDLATGAACVADEVKVFTADGVGNIAGGQLLVAYPDGGGCGSTTVPMAGRYDYKSGTDTLVDQDGVIWERVDGPADVTPTDLPTAAPTGFAACTDLSQGGTYTQPVFSQLVGSISVTATVPASPIVPWRATPQDMHLADSCTNSHMGFHALGDETSVYETSCMPDNDFTTFDEAIARLDTPQGDDIAERVDLTIDGYRAARYDIVDLSTCEGGFGLYNMTALGGGETGSVYVIDVEGFLLTIELNRDGTQTQAEVEEAQAIIESLQIDPQTS